MSMENKAKQSVAIILEHIAKLQQMGVWPAAWQHIEQILCATAPVSPLHITADYRIYLAAYNKEVRLSYLSKAIYLLFLRHPQGISLPQLHHHQDELFCLYRQLSNQLCNDSMRQCVCNVVAPYGTIFQHISRIKKAFVACTNTIDAQPYCISGAKHAPKKIMLPQDLVIWKV